MTDQMYIIKDIGIIKESIMLFILLVAGRQAAASLIKLIPGIGSVINAAVAGSFTGGLGSYCIAVFEKMAISFIPKSEQTINKRFNFIFMFSKNVCIYF